MKKNTVGNEKLFNNKEDLNKFVEYAKSLYPQYKKYNDLTKKKNALSEIFRLEISMIEDAFLEATPVIKKLYDAKEKHRVAQKILQENTYSLHQDYYFKATMTKLKNLSESDQYMDGDNSKGESKKVLEIRDEQEKLREKYTGEASRQISSVKDEIQNIENNLSDASKRLLKLIVDGKVEQKKCMDAGQIAQLGQAGERMVKISRTIGFSRKMKKAISDGMITVENLNDAVAGFEHDVPAKTENIEKVLRNLQKTIIPQFREECRALMRLEDNFKKPRKSIFSQLGIGKKQVENIKLEAMEFKEESPIFRDKSLPVKSVRSNRSKSLFIQDKSSEKESEKEPDEIADSRRSFKKIDRK